MALVNFPAIFADYAVPVTGLHKMFAFYLMFFIKDTPKALGDFKSKQKSVWSNDFLYGKVY